jgi:hypothetical protein
MYGSSPSLPYRLPLLDIGTHALDAILADVGADPSFSRSAAAIGRPDAFTAVSFIRWIVTGAFSQIASAMRSASANA